ncbi:hypothetical protein B0H19DRAFT_1257950 [Mycena capillaripes]|nr:hypothetical protein B0H19DRAFT_1257950 [Mycena capillaripes]
MTATNALKVQELCDQIASFLQESKWDLRACALVSPTFTSSAQRHLFHDIIFNRGSPDIDDIAILGRYDEAGACRRLCVVLKASPHLIHFIRRMRVSLELGVLKPLAEFEFPHLHDLVFHRRRGGPANEETVLLASKLIGAPSVRRVGLLCPIFNSMHDMGRLFEKHTPALDSIYLHQIAFTPTIMEAAPAETKPMPSARVRVKTLRWGFHYQYENVQMLDPLFPLDLSALVELDFGTQLSPAVQKLVERTRLTIARLTVDAQSVANSDYNDNSQPMFLAHLPALSHLTLVSTGHQLEDAETLLAGLPPQNRLRSLTVQIKKMRQLTEVQVRPLGAACANLHEACTVTVWVRRFTSVMDVADVPALVRTAFAELDESGRLQVVV